MHRVLNRFLLMFQSHNFKRPVSLYLIFTICAGKHITAMHLAILSWLRAGNLHVRNYSATSFISRYVGRNLSETRILFSVYSIHKIGRRYPLFSVSMPRTTISCARDQTSNTAANVS